MIHNDIQNQLALLVKTSATPLIEVAQDVTETPQWVPGERLPAFVLASLPNGRFQVQIQDQVLDMNLPRNSEPGQKLDLTFVSATPRMTFALAGDLAKTLPANSGVSLSETAKFLGALIQKGATSADATAAGVVKSPPILAGEPPANIREFATALKTAVTQSGLFYESHQAQWVSGERSLSSLMQEPQAQLPLAHNATNAVAQGGADARLALDNGVQSSALPGRDAVHPQAAPLVQQQLEALDTRQIVWQGQVWPGQNMDWQIEEDASHTSPGYDDEAPQWRTRLHLDLPSLGGVTARLAIDRAGIRVEMAAEKSDSASVLKSEMTQLATSMEASGIKVAGLTVKHG
jgi:flagellar hook-length control protein FliK